MVLFRTLTQFFVLLQAKVGEQMRAAFNVVDYLLQHLFVILDSFELKNFCCELANRCQNEWISPKVTHYLHQLVNYKPVLFTQNLGRI